MTDEDFAKEIERLRNAFQFGYMESILYWCDVNEYEIERIGHFIKKDSPLGLKLFQEAQGLHLTAKRKTGNTLPLL